MKKSVKVFVITCLAVFVAGMVSTAAGIAGNGWNQLAKAAGAGTYTDEDMTTKTVDVNKFDSLDISSKYTDVEFVNSDKYKVECTYIKTDGIQNIQQENGKLTIADNENTRENHWISLDFTGKCTKVTVYYPMDKRLKSCSIRTESGDVCENDPAAVKTDSFTCYPSYGDIKLPGLDAGTADINGSDGEMDLTGAAADSLDLGNSYGDVKLTGAKLGNGKIELDDGNLYAGKIKVKEGLTMTCDYGDADIAGADVKNTTIKMNDGNITGSGMTTGGTFKITSDTGDIRIGGDLQGNITAKAEDGNVTITASGIKKSNCSYELASEDGTVCVDGSECSGKILFEKENAKSSIKGSSSSGDVSLTFK